MLTQDSLSAHDDKASPEGRLLQLIAGNWPVQAVYVAAKLELADHLQAGPKTADQLARDTGAHPPSLYRLLRALASLGIFAEDSERRFGLTQIAEKLRKDAQGSLWATAIMMGEEHYSAWGRLLDGVRQGEVSFKLQYGQGVFDYFEKHPGPASIFHRAMTELTNQSHVAAVEAYDFSRFRKLIDVGGGRGTLLAAILKANPQLRAPFSTCPASWIRRAAIWRSKAWPTAARRSAEIFSRLCPREPMPTFCRP